MNDRKKIIIIVIVLVLLSTLAIYANESIKSSGKFSSIFNIFSRDVTLSSAPDLYKQVCEGYNDGKPMSVVKARLYNESSSKNNQNKQDNSDKKNDEKDKNKKDDSSFFDKFFNNDKSKDKNEDKKDDEKNFDAGAGGKENDDKFDAGAGGNEDEDNGGFLFDEDYDNYKENDENSYSDELDGNSSNDDTENKDKNDDGSTDVYLVMLSDFQDININTDDIKKTIQKGLQKSDTYLKEVINNIKDNVDDKANIVFAGHSIGGAVAMKAASNEKIANKYNVLATVTFGSPTSDSGFGENKSRQLCDKNDIVNSLSSNNFFFDLFAPAKQTAQENGGYKDDARAHLESYSRSDIWGDYDVLGKKNGHSNISFNKGDLNFFDCFNKENNEEDEDFKDSKDSNNNNPFDFND